MNKHFRSSNDQDDIEEEGDDGHGHGNTGDHGKGHGSKGSNGNNSNTNGKNKKIKTKANPLHANHEDGHDRHSVGFHSALRKIKKVLNFNSLLHVHKLLLHHNPNLKRNKNGQL